MHDPFEEALHRFVAELRRSFRAGPVSITVEMQGHKEPLRFYVEGIDQAIVAELMRQAPPEGPAAK